MIRKVAVIMGSDSDWPVVKGACAQLKALDIPFEAHILSAHRTPAEAAEFARNAKANGFGVILCAAGMAAHLAGAFAANTTLPVIGIPMKGGAMDGLDALLATVQMPSGIPVATVALNGAKNAAWLAAEILALSDDALAGKLDAERAAMAQQIAAKEQKLQKEIEELVMSDFAYPLHEECGVFGIYDRAGTEDVAAAAYSALYALQHRGQESCGIAVNDDGVITGHRDLGLVNEVLTPAVLASVSSPTAHMATGHVRYATAGSRVRANAQPMIVRHGRGTMALCHNGNLTNALELRRQLENEGAIFHGSSDTEVICYLVTRNRLRMGSIETAISKTMDVLEGAYSLVIMSATKLIAVRDPRGYRPLCIGTLPGGGYVFASESCALDAAGATLLRDVEPGEIVVADTNTGELRSIKDHCGRKDTQMCVFEYIYFSRPDSIIEGSSVHEARKQAGRFLAQEHPVEADVVIGVPDSGLDAALGYSEESGIPYGIGFIKNKYIGRTFIQGSQKQRENSVRIKLNVVSSTVKGKRVVLVDDSIVRGTTSARIIKLLRDAGATEVHFRVSAPALQISLLFRHRHPGPEAAGRHRPHRGADQRGHRRGHAGLPVHRPCGPAGQERQHAASAPPASPANMPSSPTEVLSTDIHERHLNDRPKDEKKLGE